MSGPIEFCYKMLWHASVISSTSSMSRFMEEGRFVMGDSQIRHTGHSMYSDNYCEYAISMCIIWWGLDMLYVETKSITRSFILFNITLLENVTFLFVLLL